MIGVFLGGIPTHKLSVLGLTSFSTFSIVFGAITGENILLAIGMVGGVALGVIGLRDKIRDYRAQSLVAQLDTLQKHNESLQKQLDEERADNDRLRTQLRQADNEGREGRRAPNQAS